jgi:hypothetical protein
MHYVGGAHNLLICEFELDDDSEDTYTRANDRFPPAPINTLDSDPTDAASSFECKSEPIGFSLGSLSGFRSQCRTMEILHIMARFQNQLSTQTDVQGMLDVLVGLCKEITGFHRCTVYRLDENHNGEGTCSALSDPSIYWAHFTESGDPLQRLARLVD